MSIHAGSIIHVGGRGVIDRIQSAGLGDVRMPTEVIREVGNREVVDKVPGDPDFTFTLESFDTSCEIEAWLTGKYGADSASANAPGASDADGTEYKWDAAQFVNIASPWKDPITGSAGVVTAGHLVPAYMPTRIRYRFGVTDNAAQEVELSGGSYYYADAAPVEQIVVATASQTAFTAADTPVQHRLGGGAGTTFRTIFGVLVNGQPLIEGVDYTHSGSTLTLTTGVPAGTVVRFCYFTAAAKSYPQTVHASALVKPGAVRGRNICVYVTGADAVRRKVGSVQAAELEATVDGEFEREFCNVDVVGYTINGRDCNGSVTVRSKDSDAFFDLLSQVTGVSKTEVFGFLNQNPVKLDIAIQNPKNPSQILKTLYVPDAIFQIPGTPARVNTPTDFAFNWESQTGVYSAFKGARP